MVLCPTSVTPLVTFGNLSVQPRHGGRLMERAQFKSFQESTKEDWDNIMVAIKDTQALVADHLMENLEHLRNDFGGFPVNRLEHSLQTATRAEKDGRDDEYIICALFTRHW
jgi:predicted HD phosphohydrolase